MFKKVIDAVKRNKGKIISMIGAAMMAGGYLSYEHLEVIKALFGG